MNMQSNISKSILNHLRDFNEATSQSSKWAENIYPKVNLPDDLNCIYAGIYVAHLKRWLYHASISNIRIYFTEHFKTHTEDIVRDALQFIGLSQQEVEKFTLNFDASSVNTNSRIKTQLLPHQQLTTALRQELQKTFAPYNVLLKNLLDVELPW